MRLIAVSFGEELMYRAAAQPALIGLTGHPWPAIFGVALLFSLAHQHFVRNPFPQSAEFLGFSLLLGFLYYAFGSLALILVVHTVRNLEIAYLDHVVKAEELGGTEMAERDEAFLQGQRLLVAATAAGGLQGHAFMEYADA